MRQPPGKPLSHAPAWAFRIKHQASSIKKPAPNTTMIETLCVIILVSALASLALFACWLAWKAACFLCDLIGLVYGQHDDDEAFDPDLPLQLQQAEAEPAPEVFLWQDGGHCRAPADRSCLIAQADQPEHHHVS